MAEAKYSSSLLLGIFFCCCCLYFKPYTPRVTLRGRFAISVDPDQMPQDAVSDQGLHSLLIIYRNFYNK